MKTNSPKLFILLFLPLMLNSNLSIAQKKDSPDHVNCYTETSLETPELKMEFVDGISKMEFVKLKIKLTNTSSDYIIFNPKECSFLIAGKTFNLSDRMLLLDPLDKGSRVLDIKGNGTNVHVDSFSINLKGLSKIKADAPSVSVPNFKLPASVNEINGGNFKIEMLKLDKETDETKVKFKVTYLGNDYGLIDPSKLAVKTDKTGDIEYANAQKGGILGKQGAILLAKGESDTFTASFKIPGKVVDMQFANMEIVWRNTFKDCKLTALKSQVVKIIIDEGKTAGKNKK